MSTTCGSCSLVIHHSELEFNHQTKCPVCRANLLIIGANGDRPANLVDPEQLAEQQRAWIDLVHSLWDELHYFAIVATDEQWGSAPQWLDNWLDRLPSFGCSCQQDFRDLIGTPGKQPNFSSRDGFFRWAFDRHNDVNAKLYQPIFSLESAYNRYGRPM